MILSLALTRSSMKESMSLELVVRPTLTLRAFTATFSSTPEASKMADALF